jgi:hypothetical protein
MAKMHAYTKFLEHPGKIVALSLSDDESEQFTEEQSNGSWRQISCVVETISQTLENSRPGSKFPLFHRIGGEVPVSTLEVDLLEAELDRIKSGLVKLPLSESRLVKFKNGKANVRTITPAELKNFKGAYSSKEAPAAKNLYESVRPMIDLHKKMCKVAKKSKTGLKWHIVDLKSIKKTKSKKKVTIRPKALALKSK